MPCTRPPPTSCCRCDFWAAVAGQGFALGGAGECRALAGGERAVRDDEPGGAQPPPAVLRHQRDKMRQPAGAGASRRRRWRRRSARLLRFAKEGAGPQPRVLLVAPLSGHFATLLRDTVRVLLPEHDVYVTDWANARDVGVWNGRFGFDEYIEHLITVPRGDGAGRARRGGVPALRPGAGRSGDHGRGRQSRPAAQHDPDGRADRHASQPDQGQRSRHRQADRLVRAER